MTMMNAYGKITKGSRRSTPKARVWLRAGETSALPATAVGGILQRFSIPDRIGVTSASTLK
jgi:hypothetical protein